MSGDLPVEVDARDILYRIDIVHLQIDHTAAFPADKMIVGKSFRIKMIHTVAHIQLLDLTDIGQKLKIAVNCAETDVGKRFPYIHIDHIRRRMVFSVHKVLFDKLPLLTVFQCHSISLKIGMITILIYHNFSACQHLLFMFIFFLEDYSSLFTQE